MKNINEIKSNKVKTSGLVNKLYKATSMGLTDNGATTYVRSGSHLLDFFAQGGSMRKDPNGALELFKKAFSEDKQAAIRILFYLRDIRGGQGERALFRKCLAWLGENYESEFESIIKHVPEYGRWDDLFFDNKACLSLVSAQISNDIRAESPSLLAKWLPTINASSDNTVERARFMAKSLGLNEVKYRKTVRSIRAKIKAVEEKMSAREWSDIDYSSVPSQAARIYKDAFKKHDEKRYSEFIDKAEKGEVKINAGTLYPYQIYKSVRSNYSQALEALWNQLPDYTQGKNALVIADTSGSMSGDPMSVSVSLALYFAERNKGQFKDYFFTFSEKPILQHIVGETLREKMAVIETGEVANTNLQAVFDIILSTAVTNNVPVEEMPSTLYIISDMQFDQAVNGQTNFEVIKQKYQASGYELPNIVFWNVNASGKNLPVQRDERGVTMVSGFSPSTFKLAVENKTPEQLMIDVINSERYSKIVL